MISYYGSNMSEQAIEDEAASGPFSEGKENDHVHKRKAIVRVPCQLYEFISVEMFTATLQSSTSRALGGLEVLSQNGTSLPVSAPFYVS